MENVHTDPEHIACDFRTNSEIVVPVFDNDNELLGIFDIDSTYKSAFDETDKIYLEAIMKKHFQEEKLVKGYV